MITIFCQDMWVYSYYMIRQDFLILHLFFDLLNHISYDLYHLLISSSITCIYFNHSIDIEKMSNLELIYTYIWRFWIKNEDFVV